MIRFADMHRDRFGVEFSCRVLRPAVRGFITARGYRAAKAGVPSARQLRDGLLVAEGPPACGKLWRLRAPEDACAAAPTGVGHRPGPDRAADAARRSSRRQEVGAGAPDPLRHDAGAAADPVNRRLTADAPRRLWACDVTYVAAWPGFASVAFVTDVYSRRIVGWNAAATLRSEVLPLQALDMAAWNAGGRLDGLTHHADHGSSHTAMVYADRVLELGAVPSTGTVGDSFDNAMAEAVNNLYKTELIRQRGPWRTRAGRARNARVGCGGGTTPAATANPTCAPLWKSSTRTTLTTNQATRRPPDRKPDRNKSQADS